MAYQEFLIGLPSLEVVRSVPSEATALSEEEPGEVDDFIPFLAQKKRYCTSKNQRSTP
jgi:hypothetical protein